MAKAVRRHGKGLNSFLYRPGYNATPKAAKSRQRISEKPQYQENDPERYHIRGLVTGGFEIVDRNTAKTLAVVDSRNEAHDWIKDAVNG